MFCKDDSVARFREKGKEEERRTRDIFHSPLTIRVSYGRIVRIKNFST